MKVETRREVEEDNIGEFQTLKSTISEENISMVLKMVSEDLYSNPIGSFIREIASNCQDANVENKVETPIVIEVKKDEDNYEYYIEFRDNGIGINPDRAKNVFVSLFNSTKRDTNTQIGGWGLGAKSPFAYVDEFYIDTVCKVEGQDKPVEYNYIYYKAEEGYDLTLLSEEETTKETGTTVRIAIKEEDHEKVCDELKQQLAYFDGVYVINPLNYYNNDFKLYEGKYFKYNSDNHPFDDMHICLGQVAYPIDYNIVDKRKIATPFALKFDVGELKVTISREGINYEKEIIAKVQERYEQAISEIYELFESQSPNTTNLRDYFLSKSKGNKLYFSEELDHYIDVYKIGAKFSSQYLPLQGMEQSPSEAIFEDFYDVTRLNDGKRASNRTWISNASVLNAFVSGSLYINKGSFNEYDSAYIEDGYVLKPKRRGASSLMKDTPRVWSHEYDGFYGKLACIARKETKAHYELGKSIKAYKYYKAITKDIEENSRRYDGIADEEWIEDYKAQKKREDPNAVRKANGILLCYDVGGRKQELKYKDIGANLVTFYKLKDEPYNLDSYEYLLSKFKGKDKVGLLEVAKTREKELTNIEGKVRHISDFFKVKAFQDYLYKIVRARNLSKYNIGTITYLSRYYERHRKSIMNFRDKWYVDSTLLPKFINVQPRKHPRLGIEENIKEMDYFLDKADIFLYISISQCSQKHIYMLTKLCKITKLNPTFYKNN